MRSPACRITVNFLKYNAGDDAVRIHSIRLAGALGMIGEANNLFDSTPKEVYADKSRLLELARVYLDGLLANRFYTKAESTVQTLRMLDWHDPAAERELQRFEARILHGAGQVI